MSNVKDAEDHRYDDIIGLSHYEPVNHPRMSRLARAAQFSPFAALTGFGDHISEEGRLTDKRGELDENEKNLLDVKFRILEERSDESPEITVTLFIPDKTKAGGKYVTRIGKLKKIDAEKGEILTDDGKQFPIKDVCSVESEIFGRTDVN